MWTRNRRITSLASATLAGALILLANPHAADAQFLKKLGDRAKEAAETESLNQVDRLVRDKIQCVFNDTACIEQATESGEEYVLTDEEGEVLLDSEGMPVSDRDQANEMMGVGGATDLSTMQTGGVPGVGEADPNYDFEPGDRILFDDDYSADNVGDFPRGMDLVRGNWDVVEWDGRRWLRNTGPRMAALDIPLPEVLPQMFTIEFDAFFPHVNHQLVIATVQPDGRTWKTIPGNAFKVGVLGPRTGVISPAGDGVESLGETREISEKPLPIRIMVDGQYAKVFVGTRRIANVPNANFDRTNGIRLINIYHADEEKPMLFGPIRIAAGGRDLYDVLEREGRFTARGILFDVNSANIRDESSEALAEIGTTLTEHPDLRLSIEGHTDGDGDDGYNLELSEQRADAVRTYLVQRFGLDPSRLEARGYGETVPVASNETSEGKQLNRRVELVRL